MADAPERVRLFHYEGTWWVATDSALNRHFVQYINVDAVRALAAFAQHENSCDHWEWSDEYGHGDCTCPLKDLMALVDGREGVTE